MSSPQDRVQHYVGQLDREVCGPAPRVSFASRPFYVGTRSGCRPLQSMVY